MNTFLTTDIMSALKILGAGIIMVTALGAAYELLSSRGRRVREVREAGLGLWAKMRGELRYGRGAAGRTAANGLHLTMEPDGTVSFREKSVIPPQT